jgi:hypothetical protein
LKLSTEVALNILSSRWFIEELIPILLSITLDSVERLSIVLDRIFYDVRIDVVVKSFRFDSSHLSDFGQIIF